MFEMDLLIIYYNKLTSVPKVQHCRNELADLELNEEIEDTVEENVYSTAS